MAWRSPGTWLAPALLTASLYDAALAEHDLALALAREAHEPGEHAERCPRCGSREARTAPAHDSALAHGMLLTIRKQDAEIARLRAENDRLRVALEVL